MKEELRTLQNRHAWDLVPPSSKYRPLGSRWVFTTKNNDKGQIVRYKARLVAQGYKQVKGESYDETFSPVVNFTLIRLFFSLLVSHFNWTHLQLDIKCAYLYAPLEETITITQPPGFEVKGKEGHLCLLKKALYGLHQSGRVWYYEIENVLLTNGFSKIKWANCLYNFNHNLVLLLYVDDIVLIGKTQNHIDEVVNILKKCFDIKILGKTKKLLGVEFEFQNNKVLIHQTQYINQVINRFKKFNIPITSLPITKGTIYSKTQCPMSDPELQEIAKLPYRNVLGCLSFIASRTRPDIAYAVNIFSQFQANPGYPHWSGLLKLLGYVNCSKELKLNLTCSSTNLSAYSDSDFAANRDDRVSMSGQLILLDRAPIHWRTGKQKSISLSTMEAEFVAITETSKEILWLNRVMQDCAVLKIIPTIQRPLIRTDNISAIDFLKSPIENSRTKHIHIKLLFIRDLVMKNVFEIKYIPSKQNLADPFTKAITKQDLSNFNRAIFQK